ncbi:MFS transporter [Gulosibacter chungangensis]|uniref:MFS transporter n=2 Tax=Gulosibacter chungangensis TaxID=979746 RepID=A0A7J5B823_9MICO|nr:MFS transporter [Gulosibacter chungangensis]
MPALLILTAFCFTGYASLLAVAPLWAVAGGAGVAGAGFVNGVLLLSTILTQICVKQILTRFGWRLTLIGGALLMGLPTGGFVLSNDLWAVLLISVLRGIGFGIITVTGTLLVAQLVAPERRGQAVGAYGLAVAVPQVLFTAMGPWLAEEVAFEVVFVIGMLPILAVWPAWLLAKRGQTHPKSSTPAPYAQLMRPMLILLALTLCGGALLTFMPQMVTPSALSMTALLLLTLTAAATRWQAGWLADKFGAKRFVWPSIFITTIGMLLVGLAVRDPANTHVWLLLTGAVVVGISYGGLQNLTLTVALQSVKPQHYGSASTVWNVGFDAGTASGSVLIGAIAAGTSFPVAMYVAAGISLLTLPLGIWRAAQEQ